MQQKRLILALLISTAILFSWSYLFPGKPPSPATPAENSACRFTHGNAGESHRKSTAGSLQVQPRQSNSTEQASRRNLLIKTPLYDAKFDSLGSEVVSWIIKKNKDSGHAISSVASDKKNKVPLELIPPEALKRQPREAPLQIVTDDTALDVILASRNYQIEGVDTPTGDVEISLGENEKRSITFLLRDSATGLDVTKRLTFDAERYSVDLEVTVKRGDQIIPRVKLKVGPSIGDQGIKHYTFYSVAPEAIAAVGDTGRAPRGCSNQLPTRTALTD